MRAVEIGYPGSEGVLALCERPLPAIRDDEVLIRVAAAGLNRGDIFQRLGRYPPPPGASDLPGLEVSGTVVAVGKHVLTWRAGDAVCALLAGGGYAEYCAAPASHCLPVPRGVTLVEAAALPEAFCTVWGAVWKEGRLAPGESLLIHGGASGIGVAAIQMASALGHPVHVTAGNEEKCAACLALGATSAIHYGREDFVTSVRAATGGRGVDVVLDMVGGDYVPRDLECMADYGRLVFISALGGEAGQFNIRTVMRRRLTMTGSTLRSRPAQYKSNLVRELIDEVWPHIEAGRIRPVIDRRFPLDAAAQAHSWMEAGRHVGKILLTI